MKDTIETNGKSGSDDTGSVYSVTRSYQRKLKKMEVRNSEKKGGATVYSPSIKDVADDLTNQVIHEEPESPAEEVDRHQPEERQYSSTDQEMQALQMLSISLSEMNSKYERLGVKLSEKLERLETTSKDLQNKFHQIEQAQN